MPTLIKDGQIAENNWKLVSRESGLSTVLDDSASQQLVPLPLWQEHKQALAESGKQIGVWLDSEEDAYALAQDAAGLPLIALNFPVFMDGRAYSAASILRERLAYQGELRAIGEVLRDQLFYMKKCGINSFEISDSVKPEDAMGSFNDFQNNYQSTTEEPLPLFRRR